MRERKRPNPVNKTNCNNTSNPGIIESKHQKKSKFNKDQKAAVHISILYNNKKKLDYSEAMNK